MDVQENTVNNLLADYLRGQGLQILAQTGVHVPSGRRTPDFELRNTGTFYGEGEWQSKYIEGMQQAIEFLDIPGCSGYFLIGYPEKLRTTIRQKRLTTVKPEVLLSGDTYRGLFKSEGQRAVPFQGTLEEMLPWIRETIERKVTREQPDEFINLMRDIVKGLTDYLPTAEAYPSLFEHIIASLPKDKGEGETARRAAAYLLLNQVVFYRILSGVHAYPPIDRNDIVRPGDLYDTYFARVLKDDYEAVFNFDIASIFPDSSVKYIRDMIKIIEDLQPEEFTRDLLGNIFHSLIPQEVRKPVAAYYTNPVAARLLARLAIHDAGDEVADFACGSGTLLMAAYEQKARLLDSPFQEHHHRTFVEQQLTGIDIMAFAAHLAVIQLALKNPGYWTDRVRIAVYDSTLLKPGIPVPSLQTVMPKGQMKIDGFAEENQKEIRVSEGALSPSGGGQGFIVEPVDVVVMNPPFTKKQFIDKEWREMLTERFSDYKEHINNEQAYWGYFVFLADRFLKENGRMALVLPASILRQQTYAGIRRLLRERYTVRFVVGTKYRSAFSESALFREVLLIAKKGLNDRRNAIFSILNVLPNEQNLEEIAKGLAETPPKTKEIMVRAYGRSRVVSQEDLARNDDWFAFLPGEQPRLPELAELDLLSPLIKVVPNIIQGLRLNRQEPDMKPINTMISHRREESTMIDWQILRETSDHLIASSSKLGTEIRIPKSALVQSTRTVTGMDKMLIDRVFDYVVVKRFPGDETFWGSTRPSEILGSRNRQVKNRAAFLMMAGRGNVDFTASGTRLLAFVSKTPIAPTWAFWSLRIQSFEDACLLALWLNSTYMVNELLSKRSEVRGSRMWFGKKKLGLLPVLNPKSLTRASRSELLKFFQEISTVSFPSLYDQLKHSFDSRLQLDLILAKAVGLEKYQKMEELKALHASTAKRLQDLKSMMTRDKR